MNTQFVVAASEKLSEESSFFHITFGELILTGATLLLAIVTVVLVVVSYKLEKATLQAVQHESNNSKEVAQTAIHESNRTTRAMLVAKMAKAKRVAN